MDGNMKLDQRQTDEEILAQYPSEKMKQAVSRKLEARKKDASSKVLHVSFGNTAVQKILAVAAIIAVMVVIPVTVSQARLGRQATRAKGADAAEGRVHAKQALYVYRNE